MGLWKGPPRPKRAVNVPGRELGALLLRAWGPCLIGRYHQARGRLVIFDRYTCNALMAAPARGDWRSRAYYWLLGHGCPAPDLTFVLDASGSVMSPKGEHSPEQLESRPLLAFQQAPAARRRAGRPQPRNAVAPGGCGTHLA